jgi:hypothetical protein
MGWFLATILAPFYAPILIVIVSAVGESQSAKKKIRPIVLMKDGQLCWLAIGFCTEALHEVTTLPACKGAKPTIGAGVYLGFLIAVLLGSAILATSGVKKQVPLDGVKGEFKWRRRYPILFYSSICLCLNAWCYTVEHYELTCSAY